MTTTDPNAQPTTDPTTQPPAQPTPPPASPQADTDTAGWTGRPADRRRLVRPGDDRMIAGVCSGLARHLGLDPTLVRVLAVLATVLGAGSVLIAYLVAWVVVPRELPGTGPVIGPVTGPIIGPVTGPVTGPH